MKIKTVFIDWECYSLSKLIRIMKLTGFLIFVTIMQVTASVYSQNTLLSLNMKNSSLKDVFREIEKQSEFTFLYNNAKINVDKEVSIEFQSAKIEEILNQVLIGTGIAYVVIDKQVVLAGTDQINTAVEAAQQVKKVTGKVTDQTGASLPGVSVVIAGTTNGTITDTDGNFSLINIPEDAYLQFSFVGMKQQKIAVQGKQVVNVVLEEDKLALDEVIVIGYGTAKRQDYTGAVSSIKMENSPIALSPNLNALEALKGNVAGLNVGATNTAGGQPTMDIRGQNSISGSNDPLIVLDGVIYLGSLGDINPNDIASYDILKDAVSSAAYGSRSANGVIAITTKKGSLGKPIITFNTSTGFQTWQNQPVMMKGKEWMDVVNARTFYPPGTTNWMKTAELANLAAGKETVWLDEVTRTGVIHDYQVAVSGAGQNVNYYLSTSYNQNKGIVVGDDFSRISLLGKVNTTITSWLKIGIDGNYSHRDYSGFPANIGEAQSENPYGAMFRDDKGNLEKYPYEQSSINPLWGVNDNTRTNKDVRNNFRLNAYSVIDVPWVKGLNFRINALINLDQNQSGNFYNENYFIKEGYGLARYEPATVVGFLSSANGNIDNNKAFSYVLDNILNYKNTFKKHSIEATLVATRDYRRYEQVNGTGSDFASNGNTALGMMGLSKATIQKVILNIDERANIGYLGRLSYSFNDKYFFTSSYRRDGASVFGVNNKWADFGAFGTAWKISNENFMKNFKPLNSLKLKLSWGQNGNQGIGPYATLSTIANGASGDVRYEFSNAGGKINYGLFQSTLGNSDLGWESTDTWNTGFESAWLENRLFADLDLYSSQTTNQIFTRNIPVMTGFKTILASMGQVNNIGIELTLRSVNIKTRDLTWGTSVTYWKNSNKLIHLYGEDKNGDGKEDDDISNSLFIGKSLGAIYGFEQDGIVQAEDAAYTALTGAAPGAPKYKDLDGVAGITAADRKILGYNKENFRLNMSNTVSYKNFEFYAMVTGTFGGNNYFMKSNTAAFMTSGTGRYNDNMTSKPYWTADNRSNVYPSAYFSGDGRFLALQSRGFIRVQDVSLAYTFNQPWVKKANINSLKVFISAKNLATKTNWFGGDPETGTPVRENTFPVPSTYSIGANISF
jgi:TonB-linked SusC/RagA family outer membrane protein